MLKETYMKLLKLKKTMDSINVIDDFIEQTKEAKNIEYYLLARLLKADIYIANIVYEQALSELFGVFYYDDIESYQQIMLSTIERLIFIYIDSGDYDTAYEYISLKRKYINVKSTKEVNRWYLEMSYVFAELGNYKKSETYLNSILSNRPSKMMEGLVLSNLTNLYLDSNEIDLGKDMLSKTKKIVTEIHDTEGIIYSKYLEAKYYWQMKRYQLAKQLFDEVFDNENINIKDYFKPLNEYISLLIDMKNYELAATVIDRFEKEIKQSNISSVLKDFYRNVIKLLTYRNASEDEIIQLNQILNAMDHLSDKIDMLRESRINSVNEREVLKERNNVLKETISKLEQTISFISIALNNDNLRDVLVEFNRYAKNIIKYDQSSFVIVNHLNLGILPQLMYEEKGIKIYHSKNDMLFEKHQPYQAITNTVVEKVLLDRSELIISSHLATLDIKDIVTGKYLNDLHIKSLIAFPIMSKDEVVGAIIFNSKSEDILNDDNVLLLKIASRLLNYKYLNLVYIEELINQKNLLNTAIKGMSDGIFYRDIQQSKLYLTEESAGLLGLKSQIIFEGEFEQFLSKRDVNKRHKMIENAIFEKNSYDITYKIHDLYIREFGAPYFDSVGAISCYVGTFNDETNVIENQSIVSELAYKDVNKLLFNLNKLDEDLHTCTDDVCTLAYIEIDNINDINRVYSTKTGDKLIIEFSKLLRDVFTPHAVYKGNSIAFYVLFKHIIDKRVINKYMNHFYKRLTENIHIQNDLELHIGATTQLIQYPKHVKNIDELNELLVIACRENCCVSTYTYYKKEFYQNHKYKLMLERYIRDGIKSESLEVGYLPIGSLIDEKIYGYEVLLSVPDQMFEPKEIIELSERNDLIITLDKYVIRRFMKEISQKDIKKLVFSFNISIKTIQSTKIEKYIIRMMNQYHVDPSNIAIEMIETKQIIDMQRVKEFVEYCHSKHIKVYLDDFGSRYNTFNTLIDLNIDIVKVDKEFILRSLKEVKAKALLEGIMTYANHANIQVIFEGIESQEILDMVKSFQGKMGQGYYFSTLKSIHDLEV